MWYFGVTIENAQDRAQQAMGTKAKAVDIQMARQRVLDSVLRDQSPSKFRTPVATKRR